MGSEPLVVSIRHTGTHTLQAILGCHKVHMHQHPEKYPGIEDRVIFVPLREPKEVWKSWAKRFPDNDPEHYKNNQVQFLLEWRRLAQFDAWFHPKYIAIDVLYEGTLRLGASEPSDSDASRIEEYPWILAFDVIYALPFVAEHYALST